MNLPIHSYRLRTASTARLVNCFAQQNDASGKSPVLLRRSPGVTLDATMNGEGRGLAVMGEMLYAVVGGTLYKIASDYTVTTIGAVPGSGLAHMAANTSQLVIVSETAGFVSDGSTVSVISDADFRVSTGCAFIDNYILFSEKDTGRYFGSDLADATSYDALNFATAEAAPDNLVTIAADHRQAVLFGTESTELHYNTGGSGFPFARVPNGHLELGIAGEHLQARCDNSVFWLASDRTVRRLDGATPVRVSQYGVEIALASADLTGAYALAYSHDGHLCVGFVLPAEETAWVYDASTNEWHERESGGSTWDAVATAHAYGSTWMLASDGRLGRLVSELGTEWGDPMRVEWTYQPISSPERQYHNSLTLGIETGSAVNYTTEPKISLEISNDCGRQWFPAPQRSLGNRGQYLTRVRWDRLGAARERVYRMSTADDFPLIVTSTEAA